MKLYEKPVVELVEDAVEVVCADGSNDTSNNGSTAKVKCKYGRDHWNTGSDTCQVCSATGGARGQAADGEHYYKENFAGCPEGLPSGDEV